MKANDLDARKTAVGLENSFIVRAPAGSGKTTLLVERFLNALLAVQKPEQVLCLTFTNKAVGEMRNRIHSLLKQANNSSSPAKSHNKAQLKLASKVLLRSEQLNWNLLTNPERLNVLTNDALCARIVSRAPLSSKMGLNVQVTPNATPLYELAAQHLLEHYKTKNELGSNVRALLKVLHNDFAKAVGMLSAMLPKRSQWLHIVLQARSTDNARQILEANSLDLINSLLVDAIALLRQHESKVLELFNYSAVALEQTIIDAIPAVIQNTQDVCTLKRLMAFLMTTSGQLRKSATVKLGFPPATQFEDKAAKELAKNKKQDYSDLLRVLSASDELTSKLPLLAKLPYFKYSDEQWDILSQLLSVLPNLVAELQLTFKRQNTTDFVEVSTRALNVLGSHDGPSEQLLQLDNSIQHILVDEFQDTDETQLQMLELLTSGWQLDDGRTIFLVGDPMQAIYGFRAANVGLFEKVSSEGIGHVNLRNISLSANFRSQANCVNWVNAAFGRIFPTVSDPNLNAISYNDSQSVKPALSTPVSLDVMVNEDKASAMKQEAQFIARKVAEIRALDPQASIGILGRKRSDLTEIINEFNSQQLGYQALNIKPLANHTLVMDLVSLTSVIYEPLNDLAWVALLRSALVGLTLNDIEIIALEKGKKYYAEFLLKHELESVPPAISNKINRFLSVFNHSLEHRFRKTAIEVVKGAFIELGGLSLANSKADLEATNKFFELMVKHEKGTVNISEMNDELAKLYVEPVHANNPISIMTLHSAKGLEFNHVFMPQCQRAAKADLKPLMLAEVATFIGGKRSPILAANDDSDFVSFLNEYSKMKIGHEIKRLAYVGLSRASVQTYLTGVSLKGNELSGAPKGSFINLIANSMDADCVNFHSSTIAEKIESTKILQNSALSSYESRVFPEQKIVSQFNGRVNVDNEVLPSLKLKCDFTEKVESAIKQILGKVVAVGLEEFKKTPLRFYKEQWRTLLKQEGLKANHVPKAVNYIFKVLTDFLSTTQWMFENIVNIEVMKCIYLKSNSKLKKHYIDMTFEKSDTRYGVSISAEQLRSGESIHDFKARMLEGSVKTMHAYQNLLESIYDVPVVTMQYLLSIDEYIYWDGFTGTYNNNYTGENQCQLMQ